MGVTPLGTRGLPHQRFQHGHGRLSQVGPAQRQRLHVGVMVQPITPHDPALGDRHMLQPPLKKVGDRQRHPLPGGWPRVALLLTRPIQKGDPLAIPRHKPRVLDRATAQRAARGENCITPAPREVRRSQLG